MCKQVHMQLQVCMCESYVSVSECTCSYRCVCESYVSVSEFTCSHRCACACVCVSEGGSVRVLGQGRDPWAQTGALGSLQELPPTQPVLTILQEPRLGAGAPGAKAPQVTACKTFWGPSFR